MSDNGSNFVSQETQIFISNLKIEWHVNAQQYHGWFVVKELLRKQLRHVRLDYEQLTTIQSKPGMIVNNKPLTYRSDDIETCLAPNQILFGRNLDLSNYQSHGLYGGITNPKIFTTTVNNNLDHFRERWRREYLVILREAHRWLSKKDSNSSNIIEDNLPRARRR